MNSIGVASTEKAREDDRKNGHNVFGNNFLCSAFENGNQKLNITITNVSIGSCFAIYTANSVFINELKLNAQLIRVQHVPMSFTCVFVSLLLSQHSLQYKLLWVYAIKMATSRRNK